MIAEDGRLRPQPSRRAPRHDSEAARSTAAPGPPMMVLPPDFLVSALVMLFVVVDPFGLTPANLGITAALPRTARRQVALRACLIAFAILAGSALIGDWLLRMMSISLS